MNRNFAKPREDMTPEYAPDTLVINGRKVYNPRAVHCKIAGYLPLSYDWPADPPQGKHYERTDKIEANGADGYKWVYVLVDDPPAPPRTFDPYKLMDALMQRNVWDTVKAWIQASPDGWDRWQRTPDIDEGEPLLKEVLAMAKESFGWSDADVEAILAASVKGGV